MIHKIHDGSSLPSVVAGTPYQIIGFGQSVNDFSTVVFPQDIKRCVACHAGAEGDRWETAPSKTTCTSCHDTTSFVLPLPPGTVLHGGGTQPDDAMCAVCHPSTGSLAGIADKHLVGLLSPTATQVALQIQSITGTAPGQAPTMIFAAMVDGAPRDLIGQPLTGLTATIAGPTTDFSTEWQATIQGAAPVGTLAAVDASAGTFSYTFPATAAIPLASTGSYEVALEGYIQPTSADPRYAALNPVLPFAVTGTAIVPRRTIVQLELCDGCHFSLAAHGGMRTNPQYCVFCHNTANFDSAGVPQFEATQGVLADTIDFRHFIHKIHMGTLLTEPYLIGGFPLPTVANPGGTPNDFAAVRYPRSPKECEACHATRNWTLPLVASTAYLPSTSALMGCAAGGGTDMTALCAAPFWTVTATTKVPPEASVCTSCHDGPDVAAHAQLNETSAGPRGVRDVPRAGHPVRRRRHSRIAVKGLLVMLILATSCSDERELGAACTADCTTAAIHPAGYLDPTSDSFHGKDLLRRNWDFALCATCHGSDFSGGNAGVSCLTCHVGGPTACATCHGANGPTSLAHPAHAPTVTCDACHVTPALWSDDGHILHDGVAITGPVPVVLGARAALTIDSGRSRGPAELGRRDVQQRVLPRRRAPRGGRRRHAAALGRFRRRPEAASGATAPRRRPRPTCAATAAPATRRPRRTSTASSRSARSATAATAARRRRHRRRISRATRSRPRSASARTRRTCRRCRRSPRRSRARRVTSCRRRSTRRATSSAQVRRSSPRASATITRRRPARARTVTAPRCRRGRRRARSAAAAVTASRRRTRATTRR